MPPWEAAGIEPAARREQNIKQVAPLPANALISHRIVPQLRSVSSRKFPAGGAHWGLMRPNRVNLLPGVRSAGAWLRAGALRELQGRVARCLLVQGTRGVPLLQRKASACCPFRIGCGGSRFPSRLAGCALFSGPLQSDSAEFSSVENRATPLRKMTQRTAYCLSCKEIPLAPG